MMSVIREPDTIVECMKNGAYDYITKEFDYDLLRHKIKNAAELYHRKRQLKHYRRKIQMLEAEVEKLKSPPSEGSSTIPLFAKDEIGDSSPSIGDDYLLTEREIEIMKLKILGLKNKEIADKLFISLITVKNHVYNILHKLNAKSMLHAIALSYENGILKISNSPKGLYKK